jgi:zinc D-Ala-D-Ala carboxypeptidase
MWLKTWWIRWSWVLPTFGKKEIKLPEPKKANYFSDKEIEGLDQELIAKLDMARHFAKTPFIITSGLRTVSENADLGGVSDSAHLFGKAVDLACSDSHTRFLMLKGLLAAGFTRIEIAPLHIHVDTDESKVMEVIFLGESK